MRMTMLYTRFPVHAPKQEIHQFFGIDNEHFPILNAYFIELTFKGLSNGI